MLDLVEAIEEHAAANAFAGVVRIDHVGQPPLTIATGSADRAHGIANTVDTRIGIASCAKGFTALAVVSLIVEGVLALDTRARSLLGNDLPLIGDDVTVEHLLAHRSGIGDYLDEDELGSITDHVMPVPVHELATTAQFLPILEGHPPQFVAGTNFAYCNGGYVVLALLAERGSGTSIHELVEQRVCAPAGLKSTAYLRTDELPGDAAVGYLAADGLRTNVLHLPVRGNGDGGIFSTVDDMHRLWTALFAGRIVPEHWVREMTRPHSATPSSERRRYGLGFWLGAADDAVMLEGYDAGASARSVHDPTRGLTWSVLSNWSDGAWPMVRLLTRLLAE